MSNLRAFRVRHRTELFAEVCQGSRDQLLGPMRTHAQWRQVAILERPSSGMPECATKFDGPGQPFSGGRLIIHPDVVSRLPDRIERKRPHRISKTYEFPQRVAAIRCIRRGYTTIGYLSTVEFEHKVGLA
jgi:hypothetical protein